MKKQRKLMLSNMLSSRRKGYISKAIESFIKGERTKP